MPSPTAKKKVAVEMDFPDALREVINGNKVTKLEWNDKNIYLILQDGYLRMHKEDDKFYNLIVREVDLLGKDWIVV